MKKVHQLLQMIAKNPECARDGALANELLREFHDGYPVEALRPLLRSSEKNVAQMAVFIASELGRAAAPLLDSILPFLSEEDDYARSDAIASILTCATAEDGRAIAKVVSLMSEARWPIRWKVMEFLSLATPEQMLAAATCFEQERTPSPHVDGLRWLSSTRAKDPDELAARMRSQDAYSRKYGVIAAARMRSLAHKFLSIACEATDEDVRRFAESMLKILNQETPKR